MEEKIKFPVVAHHRIIVNADARDEVAMRRLFEDFDLVEPLSEANSSAGGRYVSYGVSARFADAAEMARFDARLAQVPGLKMVL